EIGSRPILFAIVSHDFRKTAQLCAVAMRGADKVLAKAQIVKAAWRGFHIDTRLIMVIGVNGDRKHRCLVRVMVAAIVPDNHFLVLFKQAIDTAYHGAKADRRYFLEAPVNV